MSDVNMKIVDYMEYTARQNETFDGLALDAYNEERMASVIAEANPDYSGVLLFEGGEHLLIPVVDMVETPESLPPWRR